MAKKKSSRSANEPKEIPIHQDENRDSIQQPMDQSVEKLQFQSLKSLNDRLVKETHEKRMEFTALLQTKEALELALKTNVDQKEQVMCELSVASDGVCELELERDVVCVYVQNQMKQIGTQICGLVESQRVKDFEIGKLKSEITGLDLKVEEERKNQKNVCSERDEIKLNFDGLRKKVSEMEKNEGIAFLEIDNLKGKCKNLSGEKMESESLNKALSKENDKIKRLLDESGRVIEGLRTEVDVKMKEKVATENEKYALEMRTKELQKEISQLKESLSCFERENEEHKEMISRLNKIVEEAVEKKNDLLMEVDVLGKGLRKKEKEIEFLTQESHVHCENVNLVSKEVGKLQHTIEMLTCDKSEMEKAKMDAENIIGNLQKEISRLNEAVTSLTELSNVEKARNDKLLVDVGNLKIALDKVSIERDDARKRFADEKNSTEELNLLLKDKEKMIEVAKKELDKAKNDSFNVKEMEKQIETLVGERESMKKNFLEAQTRIEQLEAEVELAVANSDKALALLNNACLSLCDGYDNVKVEAFSEHKFVEHLDAIKASFTNKEKMVAEMNQHLEIERVEARKKKSFFTIVTAATTILAAFSALYVSKGI